MSRFVVAGAVQARTLGRFAASDVNMDDDIVAVCKLLAEVRTLCPCMVGQCTGEYPGRECKVWISRRIISAIQQLEKEIESGAPDLDPTLENIGISHIDQLWENGATEL